jgi:signal transduction histidine kinase/ActR/RegA family two-component response regulator
MVLAADGSPSFIHGVGFDVSELKETEISLKKAQEELEFRVAERTRELAETNAQLKAEIEQHKRLERELIAAKETAEQAARVKMEFLANMSHEIRTPMNGVLGFTNLVLETQLSAEQREYLSTAYHSAESLLGIINQVLDFSKLESGNARLHPIDFHLRESLQLLIRELTTLAAQKNLELSCHIAPDVPDNLKGDLGRLRQVLTNLIGNAIKFTHAGSVNVTVAPSEASLKFSVIDTGIGIPESKFKLIFEPFMQVDGSVTREYGGTGLGLAVSKNLVELMGGTLEVTSSPGEGSAFTFTARFDESDATASGKQAARKRGSQKPAVASSRALRILIAEDNPVNQKVVLRLIEKAGHTVTLAQNGREAVEAYRKSVFDLVLMDVQMPVMDGLSATETIRALERDAGIARVPIIALTAHAMEEERTRCLKAGMDIHVTKPFQSAALLSLLDELAMAHDPDPRTRLPVDS